MRVLTRPEPRGMPTITNTMMYSSAWASEDAVFEGDDGQEDISMR